MIRKKDKVEVEVSGNIFVQLSSCGLDIKSIKNYMGEDQDYIRKMLKKFVNFNKGAHEKLQNLNNKADFVALAENLHALKSNCGAIGADQLQLLMINTEKYLRDGQIEKAQELLPKVFDSLKQLLINLSGVTEEKIDELTSQKPGNNELEPVSEQQLADFTNYLEMNSTDAITLYEELIGRLEKQYPVDELKAIGQALDSYDFDQAKSRWQKINNQQNKA